MTQRSSWLGFPGADILPTTPVVKDPMPDEGFTATAFITGLEHPRQLGD